MTLQLKKSSNPPHPLTNFEIKEYHINKPRFNSVYSRDNSPKTIKKGAYVINLDEYADAGTHWIDLYMFLKKSKDLLEKKAQKKTYFECKQTIQ